MGETYRNQLKEINELNWERFKAHLDARIAELRTDLRSEMGTLGAGLREDMQRGFAACEEKFAAIDSRFASIDSRFAAIDTRFETTDGKIAGMGASLKDEFHREFRDLFRWMLAFWATTMISLIGLFVAFLKYGGH